MKKLLLIALLLAACEDRPDAPTAAQNAQLDEAEAMLDAEADEEKGPEERASDPSGE